MIKIHFVKEIFELHELLSLIWEALVQHMGIQLLLNLHFGVSLKYTERIELSKAQRKSPIASDFEIVLTGLFTDLLLTIIVNI